MYCKECGTQLSGDGGVCTNCKAVLKTETSYGGPINILTPAQQMLKKLGSSGWFTTVAVCNTLALFISFLMVIVCFAYAPGLLEMLVYSDPELMYSIAYYDLMYTLDAVSDFLPFIGLCVGFILSIPGLLQTISLWMIRASAGKKDKPMKRAGFVILKVMTIIYLVIMAIIGVFYVALFSLFVINVFAEGETAALIVGIVILFVWLAILALSVLIPLKIIKSLNSAIKVIKTGKVHKKPSRLIGVLCWIMAVNGFINVVSCGIMIIPQSIFGAELFQNDFVGEMVFVTGLVQILLLICNSVSYLACGILSFKARSAMLQVMQPAVTKLQAAAPAQPMQSVQAPVEAACEETVPVTEEPAEEPETLEEPQEESQEEPAVLNEEN